MVLFRKLCGYQIQGEIRRVQIVAVVLHTAAVVVIAGDEILAGRQLNRIIRTRFAEFVHQKMLVLMLHIREYQFNVKENLKRFRVASHIP